MRIDLGLVLQFGVVHFSDLDCEPTLFGINVPRSWVVTDLVNSDNHAPTFFRNRPSFLWFGACHDASYQV